MAIILKLGTVPWNFFLLIWYTKLCNPERLFSSPLLSFLLLSSPFLSSPLLHFPPLPYPPLLSSAPPLSSSSTPFLTSTWSKLRATLWKLSICCIATNSGEAIRLWYPVVIWSAQVPGEKIPPNNSVLQKGAEIWHIMVENDIDCVLLNKLCHFQNCIKGRLWPSSIDTIIILLQWQLDEGMMT